MRLPQARRSTLTRCTSFSFHNAGCPAKKPFYSGDNQEDANDRIAGILGTMVCIMMTNPECKFTASQMGDFINNALKCLQVRAS